jgi:hypothetical protein
MKLCLVNLCLATPMVMFAFERDLDEALLQASKTGNAAKAKSMVEQGARVNTRTLNGLTPLMFAAQARLHESDAVHPLTGGVMQVRAFHGLHRPDAGRLPIISKSARHARPQAG